jgi:hypothetical protein
MLSSDRYIFAPDARAESRGETQRAFQSFIAMRSVVASREERDSPLPAVRIICNSHVTQRNRGACVLLLRKRILPLNSTRGKKAARTPYAGGENNAADNATADGFSAGQFTKLYTPRRVNSRRAYLGVG